MGFSIVLTFDFSTVLTFDFDFSTVLTFDFDFSIVLTFDFGIVRTFLVQFISWCGSQVAVKTLPFYKDYFKIAYPLPKMDLIAIQVYKYRRDLHNMHIYPRINAALQ